MGIVLRLPLTQKRVPAVQKAGAEASWWQLDWAENQCLRVFCCRVGLEKRERVRAGNFDVGGGAGLFLFTAGAVCALAEMVTMIVTVKASAAVTATATFCFNAFSTTNTRYLYFDQAAWPPRSSPSSRNEFRNPRKTCYGSMALVLLLSTMTFQGGLTPKKSRNAR